jgi:hypothetical protein
MWVNVYGFPKYEVNEKGEIRNKKTKQIKKPTIKHRQGYYIVVLYGEDKKKHTKSIHVLVLMSFKPVNKNAGYDIRYTVNHIDGNKANNRLDNLEWCTHEENQQHAFKNGLRKIVKVICLDDMKIFDSYIDAARSVNGNAGAIKSVCDGTCSHHKGKHFARLEDYKNSCIPPFKGQYTKRYKKV